MREQPSSVNSATLFDNCVDFHTHILPQMDDGSRSVEESIQMLEVLSYQGVTHVNLTPHFYADGDTPERFFARRQRSFTQLNDKLITTAGVDFPKLILGAEVEYFEGISDVECIPDFSIGNSGCILLEMPMAVWPARVVDDILRLNDRTGCRVILAHVERYLFEQKKDVVNTLVQNRILMQSNASFFINRKSSKKAVHLLKGGLIRFIGSDCHNMTTRPPNIIDAMTVIAKMAGKELLDDIMSDARYFLEMNI